MKALEEGLTLDQKLSLAGPVIGRQPYWLAWVRSAFYSIFGKISPYEYVARVLLAKKRLDELVPEHRSAARVVLEGVVLNLAPDPWSLRGALRDDSNGRGDGGFTLLNDVVCERAAPKAVALRYATLARALSAYMEVCIGFLERELEEEPRSQFSEEYRRFREQIGTPARELVAARQAFYQGFPEAYLTSVSEAACKAKRGLTVREDVKDPLKLEREIARLERFLTTQLEGVMQRGNEEIKRLAAREARFLGRAEPLHAVVDKVKAHLPEEVQAALEEMLAGYEGRVVARFDPTKAVPASVFADCEAGRLLYRSGELGGLFAEDGGGETEAKPATS